MYPSKILPAGLCLLTLGIPARAQEWTEQALLNLFELQSPIVRETQAAVAVAVETVRGRTLWPNPIAAYSRETVGFTEFFQAEQQLPVSGRLKWERQAMEPARKANEAQGAARMWDARSSLRAAFYRALAAQGQAESLQTAIEQIGTVIELLQVREREGEGSRYDRARVEREGAELRADLALAKARASSERAAVLAYLPQQTVVATLRGDLTPKQILPDKEAAIRQALDARADVRAEGSRISQLVLEQRAAERLRVPEPMFTAGVKRTQVLGGQTDTGLVIGVSVPLPTFNKGQTEVARLTAEQNWETARRDLLSQQIAAAVGGAYDVYVARLESLQTFDRETRDAGEELLRMARVGYEEGELGILQLLDAYRLERQTALRRLEILASIKEMEIELSRSAGFEVIQ